MAVTDTNSTELSATRNFAIVESAKLRFTWFTCTQGAAAGDAGSTFQLCKLPPGRIRVLPGMSRLWTSAFGASRVAKIGHGVYVNESGADVAADDDAFGASIDISSAVNNAVLSNTIMKHDVFTRSGFQVFATVTGGTIPAAATFNGYIAYVAE